ncbi:MAG TPA: inorganic diphosphatase [Thermoanaerobaculia bacterium]|nr:inorganic diphosphatase [Thermoanaerobaculia bacterium]
MKKNLIKSGVVALALLLGTVLGASAVAQTLQPQVSVLKGEKNFWTGYDPVNVDGSVNVVIEIAAGTTAKYMVELKTGMIELEQKNGGPRYVQYLGYPCNYGNIPRSVLLKSKGGDGDAVDALVLGPSVPTGSVVRGRAIGMLSLVDTGEKDDKVVVVMENTPFFNVRSIDELDRKFPGVVSILQTWFTSYKGRDKDGKLFLSSPGFKGRAETIKFIGDAVLDYENSVVTDADRRPLDEKGNPYLYRWPGAKNVGE